MTTLLLLAALTTTTGQGAPDGNGHLVFHVEKGPKGVIPNTYLSVGFDRSRPK